MTEEEMQLIHLISFAFAFNVEAFYSNLESFIFENYLPLKLKHGMLLGDINTRVKKPNFSQYTCETFILKF